MWIDFDVLFFYKSFHFSFVEYAYEVVVNNAT